jgi:hypothetical protein
VLGVLGVPTPVPGHKGVILRVETWSLQGMSFSTGQDKSRHLMYRYQPDNKLLEYWIEDALARLPSFESSVYPTTPVWEKPSTCPQSQQHVAYFN